MKVVKLQTAVALVHVDTLAHGGSKVRSPSLAEMAKLI